MTSPITGIELANPASISAVNPQGGLQSGSPQSGSMFHEIFNNAVNTVENFGSQADAAVQNLLSGANEDLHTPIIATQKADLSFQLFLQVRNKVISAYQTLMGMQV
jgi:flagellar hook-basal body complex protein FliE